MPESNWVSTLSIMFVSSNLRTSPCTKSTSSIISREILIESPIFSIGRVLSIHVIADVSGNAPFSEIFVAPETIEAYQKAQGQLSQALGRLMMVTENYPQLKADANFRDLQAQLEGTENRVKVERDNYSAVANTYNTMIQRFPKNILAGLFGFDKRDLYKAQTGAENSPKVDFTTNQVSPSAAQ